MKAEIRQNQEEPGSYDLFVNGALQIVAESFIVVNNVKAALIGGYLESLKHTEADEIAATIRKGQS